MAIQNKNIQIRVYLIRICSDFVCVPSMALILLVKVQSRVFTAKCSEPQVGASKSKRKPKLSKLEEWKLRIQDLGGTEEVE